jgi:hypothetical protein
MRGAPNLHDIGAADADVIQLSPVRRLTVRRLTVRRLLI